MEECIETTTPCKYEDLGAAMAAELMIGFWFGIGVILAIRIVDSLDYCIEALMSNKGGYCYKNGRTNSVTRTTPNDERLKEG